MYLLQIHYSLHILRKFKSGTQRVPSFLESDVVFFLKSSYLILLIKVLVSKSYLP